AAQGQCTHDACRLAEARRANAASPGRARQEQVEMLRKRIVDALAVERIDAKLATLARLQKLREFAEAGNQTLAAIRDDEEVRAKARAAIAYAAAERARVPLLRADLHVIEE